MVGRAMHTCSCLIMMLRGSGGTQKRRRCQRVAQVGTNVLIRSTGWRKLEFRCASERV